MRYVTVVRVLAIEDAQPAQQGRYGNVAREATSATEREVSKLCFSRNTAEESVGQAVNALAALAPYLGQRTED